MFNYYLYEKQQKDKEKALKKALKLQKAGEKSKK